MKHDVFPYPTPEVIKKIHEQRTKPIKISKTDECFFCRKNSFECHCDDIMNESIDYD